MVVGMTPRFRVPRYYGMLAVAAGLAGLHAGPAQAFEITAQVRALDTPSASVTPLYTTIDAPANHVVTPPTFYDGVASLFLARTDGNFGCSGALLADSLHVLTAAHCVTNSSGVQNVIVSNATFNLSGGPTLPYSVTGINVAPGWTGNATMGNDLAILTLAGPATGIQSYDIYRGSGELGVVGDKAGYGKTGTGTSGDTQSGGTLRSGQNIYDAYGSIFNVVPGVGPAAAGANLAYDFDDGTAAHDGFGFFFGINNLDTALVLANQEVMSAPGDSGGPTFIDGVIAGITSYGLTLAFGPSCPPQGCTSDIDSSLNSTYGEFGVDTRISYYQSWIESIVDFPNAATAPEPASGAVLLFGTVVFFILRRKPLAV